MMIIYKSDFSNFHEITHAKSIHSTAKYGDIGKFSMVMPINDYNLANIEKNGIIYDTESKNTYILVNRKIETKNNTITVNGYSAEWLLSKRGIAVPKYYPASEEGIYQMVTDNLRGLPIELASLKGLGGTGTYFAKEGQLIDNIIEIAKINNFGFRVNFDYKTKKFTFEVYKGKDLTSGLKAQIFSYERGNARALTINEDVSLNYTTFTAVGMLNGIRYAESYSTDSGTLGNEKIIDCGWMKLGDGYMPAPAETIESYKRSLKSRAMSASSTYTDRKSFKIEIEPKEYGVAYNLGDIVTCISTKFGVKFNKRITSVNYQLDANGTKTDLILGEPELTKTEADKLGGY